MTWIVPEEFDLPYNHGLSMKGWDFSREEISTAIEKHRMLNPAMELGTNVCPWNCSFCFTEDPANMEGRKHRLAGELSTAEKLQLIDQAADLGAKSINFVGAGEPTIAPDFWEVLAKMRKRNITPIVYTEGALKLTDYSFALKLYEMGATVVLKVNSLKDEEYQNAIVSGPSGRKTPRQQNYFKDRNQAIQVLMDVGFNQSTPTRLAFDTIICKENADEVPEIHEYARSNNIFVLFVNYLPSGRSSEPLHNAISREQQFKIFADMAKVDKEKYGIEQRAIFPYAGSVPCTIRGLGLYVKITGAVHDCPGELISLGNIRKQNLKDIWEKAKPITQSFNGGCAPREAFWERLQQK